MKLTSVRALAAAKVCFNLSLLCAYGSIASASTSGSIVQGSGNGTQSFAVNADVSDACTLSMPADVNTQGVLYWTKPDSATGTTSVNVTCNRGVMYDLSVSTSVVLSMAGTTRQLSAAVSIDSPNEGPFIAGQNGDAANTPGGQVFPLFITVGKPGQFYRSGVYSGVASVTLSLVSPP